jgi:Fe-S cluster biogenesis protein NfuA
MPLTQEQRTAAECRAQEALNDLRPFLAADGGDITLEEVTEDGTARVRLHGACVGCAMSAMTMKAGVEEAIRRATPDVLRVEAVGHEMVA